MSKSNVLLLLIGFAIIPLLFNIFGYFHLLVTMYPYINGLRIFFALGGLLIGLKYSQANVLKKSLIFSLGPLVLGLLYILAWISEIHNWNVALEIVWAPISISLLSTGFSLIGKFFGKNVFRYGVH